MTDAQPFGWCLRCNRDVPVDADRRCLTDRAVCIPPSWGSRTQEWIDGAWFPDKPKPAGYVYTPPGFLTVVAEPKPDAPTHCGHCGAALVVQAGGGSPRGYCDTTCKMRANNKAKNARQRERNAARPPVIRECAHCGATFTRPPGKPQKFCSHACQVKAKNARRSKGVAA